MFFSGVDLPLSIDSLKSLKLGGKGGKISTESQKMKVATGPKGL